MFILKSKLDEMYYAGVDHTQPQETQDKEHAARFADIVTARARAQYLKDNFGLVYEPEEL
jgi:hypothetical protein